MKVLTIIGTRPEAVKLGPVVRELQRRVDDGIDAVLCVTGQHRQMLDPVLELFQLVPEYDLNVMTRDQSLAGIGAAILNALEPVLRSERPDWVLVQGDTTTVAAAALAAAWARCHVGHVEAGLRTYDRAHPFPEEINRRVAGVVADFHFAPTARARANLLQEHVPPECVLVTGNPGIDALHWVAALPEPPALAHLLPSGVLHAASGPRFLLVTAHRRENFGAPLEQVCLALRELAARWGENLHIAYPVHLNPRVQEAVHCLLDGVSGITLCPPLDYATLVHLLKRADLVLTDSGGLQEEAPSLGKPVLVLRDVTERPEAVEAGAARLVGTDSARIVAEVDHLLGDPAAYAAMARVISPYGDGRAAERIVAALLRN